MSSTYDYYVYKTELNETTVSLEGYKAKKKGKHGQIFFWLKKCGLSIKLIIRDRDWWVSSTK